MKEHLELAYIEGMMAFLSGVDVSECPLDGDRADQWKLGYLEQKLITDTQLKVVRLRQAIKCQAKTVQDYIDIKEQMEHDPDTWWASYLTADTREALTDSSGSVKVLEAVLKNAVRLHISGGFSFQDGKVVVPEGKEKLFQDLHDSVATFLEKKC